jgi:hypothetical protein
MTIQFQPEQERVIDQAIQAGLIGRADEVVEVGPARLRSRARPRVGDKPSTWFVNATP